jgi:hypothetical protein
MNTTLHRFWLPLWYLQTLLTTNKAFHRQYECQMTSIHYFDISLKKIPSYVQLKFNIKSNIHKIITTCSTYALDNRLKVTFAFVVIIHLILLKYFGIAKTWWSVINEEITFPCYVVMCICMLTDILRYTPDLINDLIQLIIYLTSITYSQGATK